LPNWHAPLMRKNSYSQHLWISLWRKWGKAPLCRVVTGFVTDWLHIDRNLLRLMKSMAYELLCCFAERKRKVLTGEFLPFSFAVYKQQLWFSFCS